MASYRDKLPATSAASVVSVQRATVSASGITTDVNISPVDITKSYIRHSVAFTSTVTPMNGCYNIELVNPTTVRVTRASAASNAVFPIISVEVVSDSSVSVQRGVSSVKGIVTISSVNTGKSFATANGVLSTSTSTTGYPERSVSASLLNSTSISLSSSASGSNYKWEVVSYA